MSSLAGKTLYASGFDPRSIPNCALWLDAADSNSLTLSGNNVTQWNDKSGNGKNATPVSGNTVVFKSPGQNNLPVCNFGNNRMNISNFNWRTSFTVALVTQANAGTFLYSLWGTNYINYVYGGNWNLVFLNTSLGLNDSVVAQGNSATGSGFCIAIYQYGLTGTPPPWRLNGTQRSTVYAVGSYPGDITLSGTLYLNGNGNNSTDTSQIAEIIHYNNYLTTQQCQQLEGYLASKWGLRGNLPATHPFKLYPIYTRPFQPVDISSCSLWLDSTDICGNGNNPAIGTAISVWADKSGNGNDLTQTVASNQPIFTASGVSFDGTSSFMTTTNPNIRPAIFYTVVQANTLSGIRHILRLGTSGGTNAEYYLRQSNADIATAYYNTAGTGVAVGIGGGATTDLQLISSTWDGSTIYFYKNGGLSNSGSLSGTQFVASNATIFGLGTQSNTATNVWSGTINEVIFFNSYPTDTERQQVESYLANKWNLKSLLPSTHAFKLYNSVSSLFTPVQIPGCGLWLDSMEINPNAANPSVGTAITTWYDKSGNSRNLVQNTGSNQPTFTASGVSFNGSNSFMSRNNLTVRPAISYVVVQPNTLVGTRHIMRTDNEFFVRNNNATTITTYYNTGLTGATGNGGTATTNLQMITSTWDGTNIRIYRNGNLIGTTAFSGSPPTNQTFPFAIGSGSNTVTNVWSGTINEIIIYNRLGTSVERGLIEGYLAHKWGLLNSLPASHPYKNFRP
jgi:hypothetical protein